MKAKRDALRQRMIQQRLAMPAEEKTLADQAIQRFVWHAWNDHWKTILIYVNQPDEVVTIPLILEWIRRKKELCVPVFDVQLKRYFASVVKDFEKEMDRGYFGILEPKASARRPKAFSELDVIFIPGLAFDRFGNRLGYGRGYFDMMCRGLDAVKIGLAYHFQLIDRLETHAGDVPMNRIITEKGMMECPKL